MFGRHKMTNDAIATVVSCSDANHNMSWDSGGYHYRKYDLVLDVYPAGGLAPFRAGAEHSFAMFLSPNPGDQLKARCNPEQQTVAIDTDDDPRFDAKLHHQVATAQREAEHAQDLAAPPGTAPSAYAAARSGVNPDANLDPELQEQMRLEEEERRGGGAPPPSPR